MNKTSLSSLYRRLTATSAMTSDAADLAAAADASLASERREAIATTLAESSAQAKVVQMLRDLRNDSAALATDVARTQRETTHRRHQRDERRTAAGRRGALRWATALAACMVAVVGMWSLRHAETSAPMGAKSHSAIARADVNHGKRDRIFSVGMDNVAPDPKGDHLFRGDFSGG